MPVCRAPPGRRSISHTGMVQPSGPSSQLGTCSGLVKASHTSRRGASNTRVATISTSDGVVNVVVPMLFAVTIVPLPFFHGLKVRVQPLVAGVPEAAIVLRPLRDFPERLGLQLARPPL